MWSVFESRDVQKTLPRLPMRIRERYEAWKALVEVQGPEGLRGIRGFYDEALHGNWQGFRSSRLNAQYRVIYFVEGTTITVHVERIAPHDYRR